MNIIKKNIDGTIHIIQLNQAKYGVGLKDPSESYALKDIESSDWFEYTGDADVLFMNPIEQLFVDVEDNVQCDTSWSKNVMPDHVIKSKYIKQERELLDSELEKEIPDPTKVIRINRNIELVAQWSELDIVENAISGLDGRIAEGKSDKSEIRAKLTIRKNKIK